MNRVILQILLAFFFLTARGQDEKSIQYAQTITQGELKYLLNIIASDSLEGRDTGSHGLKLAASFIEQEFKSMGLQPVVPIGEDFSYRQTFVLENYNEEAVYLEINDKVYSLSDNMLYKGSLNMKEPTSGELFFITPDMVDMNRIPKEEGKIALFSTIGLNNVDYNSLAEEAYAIGFEMVVFVPFESESDFKEHKRSNSRKYAKKYLGFEQKINENIPKGYFLVTPKFIKELLPEDTNAYKLLLSNNSSKETINNFNQKKYSANFFVSPPAEKIKTENIVGYLEGSEQKDELIVIMAHYDHVGVSGEYIYNGADDNGSGTSAVMEIAEAFSLAKKDGKGPRRSVLFLLVSAEEIGLLGSHYYTSNPLFPLSSTVTALNLDMIGRYDEDHKLDKNFIYVVGSDKLSSELDEISTKANKKFTDLYLDYSYNDKDHPTQIYYRSDHWSFAKYGIPVIFYFSGLHNDYHKPTDTADKIEYNLLEKRAQLVFHTAWIIANRPNRLIVDKKMPAN